MKRVIRLSVIVFLLIVFLMGCTTLRYADKLTEPYSQTEMEITGAGTIVITALGILAGSIIYDNVQ